MKNRILKKRYRVSYVVEKLIQEDSFYHSIYLEFVDGLIKDQDHIFIDSDNLIYRSYVIIKEFILKFQNESDDDENLQLFSKLINWKNNFDDYYCGEANYEALEER